MNKQIKSFLIECGVELVQDTHNGQSGTAVVLPENGLFNFEKFAELIVKECINREELLGAIARGWCSEKNEHKTMDSDLAFAIFDEVEKHIKEHFGVEE